MMARGYDLELLESEEPEVGDFESMRVYRNPRLGYIRSVHRSAADRELDEREPEIVHSDERRPVLNTVEVPYRWICHLQLNFGPDPTSPGNDITGRGTGTLISPRHVLTCGHNLYNDFPDIAPNLIREVRSVRVTPGYNCAAQRAAPFGFAPAASWRYHSRWRSGMEMQFDYGLITLNSAIGARRQQALGNRPLGFWGSTEQGEGTRINPRAPNELQGRRVNISGYPGDKCCYQQYIDLSTGNPIRTCRSQAWAGAQFRASGTVTNASPASAPRLILYDADTYGGHSGSPVWLLWGNFRNLIAIHTGPGRYVPGESPGISNRGVRITADVLRDVQSWMR
jgi:V8-like Glu-specific endopeptidase